MDQQVQPMEHLYQLQIMEQRLLRAQEKMMEAKLARLQRATALQEQEAESVLNEERRQANRREMAKHAEWENERRRPSMALGTDVYFDETEEKWACQHCGVTAHGDTPAMACENFDHLWVFGT